MRVFYGTEKREKEKDSRYIQEASAPAAVSVYQICNISPAQVHLKQLLPLHHLREISRLLVYIKTYSPLDNPRDFGFTIECNTFCCKYGSPSYVRRMGCSWTDGNHDIIVWLSFGTQLERQLGVHALVQGIL